MSAADMTRQPIEAGHDTRGLAIMVLFVVAFTGWVMFTIEVGYAMRVEAQRDRTIDTLGQCVDLVEQCVDTLKRCE